MSEDQPRPGKKKIVKKVIRKKVIKKKTSGGSVAPQPGLKLEKTDSSGALPLMDESNTGTPAARPPATPTTSTPPSNTPRTKQEAKDASPTGSGLLRVPADPVEDSDYSKLEPWKKGSSGDLSDQQVSEQDTGYVIKGADGPSMFDEVVYGEAGQAGQKSSQASASPQGVPAQSAAPPAPSQPIQKTQSGFGVQGASTPPAAMSASAAPSNPLDDVLGDAYDQEIPRSSAQPSATPQQNTSTPSTASPQALSAADMGMGDDHMDELTEAQAEAGPKKKKSKAVQTLFHLLWLILSFGTTWGAVAYFQTQAEIPGISGVLTNWINPGSIVIVLIAFWFLMMLFRFRWFMMFLFLFLSPFTVSLGMGAVDYFTAKGLMRTANQPDNGELLEIEPGSRALWSTEDIRFPKNMKVFSYFAYNQGLSLAGSVMGPMSGRYDGPMLTQEETAMMLNFMDSAPFGRAALRDGTLSMGEKKIELTEVAGHRMINLADEIINEKIKARAAGEEGEPQANGFKTILASLYSDPNSEASTDELLLIAFLEGRGIGEPDHAYVALVDAERGDWLRVYEIGYNRLSAEAVVALDNPFLTNEANAQRKADRMKAREEAEQRNIEIANEEAKGQDTDEVQEAEGLPEQRLSQAVLATKPGKWDQVRIGMSERRVRSLLGKPEQATSLFMEYGARGNLFSTDPHAKSWVVFLKNGRVTQLRRPLNAGQ